MKQSTILQLNQINKRFYDNVAKPFSQTRQTAWAGWEKCWEEISNKLLKENSQSLTVCDVGCGNGRFAAFCLEKLKHQVALDYLGLDNNQALLDEAKQKFANPEPPHMIRFQEFDIIDTLISEKQLQDSLALQFSVVSCFGIFHHVPSEELRIKLMKQLEQVLMPGGLLIVAFWQCHLNTALMEKRVTPEHVGILPEEIEENDFFLTWGKEGKEKDEVRYCHLTTPAEQERIVKETGLRILEYFSADGVTGGDNNYYILQKAPEISWKPD